MIPETGNSALVVTNDAQLDAAMFPLFAKATDAAGVHEDELTKACHPLPAVGRWSDYFEFGWITPVINSSNKAVHRRWKLTPNGRASLERAASMYKGQGPQVVAPEGGTNPADAPEPAESTEAPQESAQKRPRR